MDGQFFSIPLNRVARTLPSVSQLIPSLTRLIEPPPILHKTILADIAGYDTTNRTDQRTGSNRAKISTFENDSVWLNNRGTNRDYLLLSLREKERCKALRRTCTHRNLRLYQFSRTSSNKFELILDPITFTLRSFK